MSSLVAGDFLLAPHLKEAIYDLNYPKGYSIRTASSPFESVRYYHNLKPELQTLIVDIGTISQFGNPFTTSLFDFQYESLFVPPGVPCLKNKLVIFTCEVRRYLDIDAVNSLFQSLGLDWRLAAVTVTRSFANWRNDSDLELTWECPATIDSEVVMIKGLRQEEIVYEGAGGFASVAYKKPEVGLGGCAFGWVGIPGDAEENEDVVLAMMPGHGGW